MYTCDALETIQSKTLLHTFAPNYTVLWRLKRNFLFPHTPLVISSFNRYHWPKIIISMPFDSSNQLYFVVLVFLWAYMRHVELSYILEVTRMHGDPQLSASLAPKTPISPKGPCFRGCFCFGRNHSKTTTFWGNREHFSLIEIKDTHFRNVATHRTIWTNLHAYTQIPLFLPVPSLRILGVCECQPHPIINMMDQHTSSSIHHTVCPKQLVPISGLMHFSTPKIIYNTMQYFTKITITSS